MTYNPALLFLTLLHERNLYPTLSGLCPEIKRKTKRTLRSGEKKKKNTSQCIRNKLGTKCDECDNFNLQWKVNSRIPHVVSKQLSHSDRCVTLNKSCHLSGSPSLLLSHGLLSYRPALSWSGHDGSTLCFRKTTLELSKFLSVFMFLQCMLYTSISSVQFSRSVVSGSLRPHESQHARPPCPSPTPGLHSDSHPSSH